VPAGWITRCILTACVTTDELREKLKANREGERRGHHSRRQAGTHGRVIEIGNIALELGYEVAYSTVPPKS
jgi:hypothetical protein